MEEFHSLRPRNFTPFLFSRGEKRGQVKGVKILFDRTKPRVYVSITHRSRKWISNGNFRALARANFKIEPANDLLGFRFTLPARLQTHGARFKCYSTPRTVAETQTLRYARAQRLDHRYSESCLNQVQPVPRLNIVVMPV